MNDAYIPLSHSFSFAHLRPVDHHLLDLDHSYCCWQLSIRHTPIVTFHNTAHFTTHLPKMYTATIALASSLAFSQVVLADYGWQFGNAFSTGPVASNSFIRESNTTLVLPEVNSPQTGNLALWPGMGTSGGDLIQALAISVADGR